MCPTSCMGHWFPHTSGDDIENMYFGFGLLFFVFF